MDFYYSFNSFNPLKGDMPKLFSGQFKYIADKARNILLGRSNKEIQFGLKTINWMYSNSERAFMEGMLIMSGKDDVTFYITPTLVLASQINKFDITKQEGFKKAQWEDYFAILALALIGNAVYCEKIQYPYFRLTKKEIEKLKQDSIGDSLADAMEAICYSESLITKNELLSQNPITINDEIDKKVRLRNQQAAIARHAPMTAIKKKFAKFYKERKFKVFKFAVNNFYKELSEDEKRIIAKSGISIDEQIEKLIRTLKRFMKNEFPELLNMGK